MKTIYENVTKKLSLFAICIFFSMVSFSATYYVSNAGIDTNNGLSETSSWKTLAKVNAATLLAGDVVKFKCGDSWFGTLTPQRATISYGAYSTGAKPIISGLQAITGWTNLGNGIYSAPTTALNTLNIVTVNDVLTAKGRYPNTGYLSYETHSGTTSITDSQLAASPSWTGAEVAVRSYAWTLESRTITNHSGSSLTFSALGDEPTNGYGYFFQNDLKALDLQGEWCIKNGTFYMFFGTQNPTNFTVKVSVLNNLIYTYGKAAIAIDGLNFQGANLEILNLLSATSTNNKITNCDIEYGLKGICAQGPYLTIENNTISDCIGYGIFTTGTNDIIRNNTVANIGLPMGVEATREAGCGNGINSYGSSSIVEYNTIRNVGYDGIDFRGTNTSINNNFIDGFCNILTDGAGIYTANQTLTGSFIRDNVIVNGISSLAGTTLTESATVGIYLDEGVNSFTVSGNSVSNIDGFGIFLHGAKTINVTNNTVYNCSKYQYLMAPHTSTSVFSGINITDNIFVAKELGQRTLRFFSLQNDLNFGTANGNIYARPIEDNLTFNIDTYNAPATPYNLAGWKTLSGFDATSTKSPIVITNTSQFQYESNTSKIAKTITLTSPMVDMKGIKYASSVVIQPFKSIVLMKDLTADITLPIVTAFTIPTTSTSLTVSISTYTATDNIGVTGYLLTETNFTPSSAAAGWSSTKPTNFVFSTVGSKTLYAWVKDAAGNVSASLNGAVIISSSVATTFTITGPTSGNINSISGNFTVTPNHSFTGTITIIPSGAGSAGLSAKVLAFSNSSAAQVFSITTAVAGSIVLTPTNNGGLINPANLAYTVNAVIPGAPTSVIATAGNATASVTFVAPANNGGSSLTGYTVTSIPAGGIDINSGSTSLTHSITGLTNGASYIFTSEATNSAGASVASASSNLVIPFASDINTFSKQISAGMDDVEESTTGFIYYGSSDIELVYDSYNSQGNQIVGLRFNSIAIPSGATITNAYIQFTADAPTSLPTNLNIYGQKVNNAEIFTVASKNVSNRQKTTSLVSWVPGSWVTDGDAGTDQQTPELKSIVQEIVQQSGWTSGNSMVFIISGTGTRVAKSYEKSSTQAAILSIEYTNTNTGISDAPTSVIATAGNATASVTFVAPANNGNSSLTGYTVTSIPSGGIDINAGSTLLTHSISGLVNGTSYSFTVKATNAAGTSLASMASNSLIPSAPVAVATTFTLTGPSSGNVNSPSANFTVTPNNSYTGTITLTPSGTGSTGLSAKVLTFTNSSAVQVFSITPTVVGSIALTPTNNGGLINPANFAYTVNALIPSAPTSVIAIAGNATASVTFAAPANNGGSVITGYTVTSIPAGGIDINAGSTLLTHSISGLTNGVLYTFTVKATNPAGTSVASIASNLVKPVAPVYYTENVTICQGSNYLGWTTSGSYERNLIAASGADSIVTTNLTVNPLVTPIFADFGTFYLNSAAPVLPGTSSNGIIGSWIPSVITTGSIGTTVYTFTPNSGQCATTAIVTIIVNPTPTIISFSKRISTGIDDVEESAAGAVYTNSSDIELVYDSWNSAGNQVVGLRFNSIAIPVGAIITNAYIQFTSTVSTSGTTNLSVSGQKVNNAEVFTVINKNVSNRAKTIASVSWVPASWSSNAAGMAQQTPDLKNIVQEIVQLSGWASNNSMAFIITGTGTRTAKSYENSSSQAALLSIKYTLPLLKMASTITGVKERQIIEPIREGKLSCYPSPFIDILNINFDPSNDENLKMINIFDLSGNLVKSINSLDNFISVPMSEFKAGIYMVRVVSDKKSYTQKVVKM